MRYEIELEHLLFYIQFYSILEKKWNWVWDAITNGLVAYSDVRPRKISFERKKYLGSIRL